jgi:hypothetical protein
MSNKFQWINITYLFSYWIFAWYLIYYFSGFDVPNPKLALIGGAAFVSVVSVLMFLYKTKPWIIATFVIMNIIVKFIPLYSIWTTTIHLEDWVATFILLTVYLGWMYLNGNGLGFHYYVVAIKNLINNRINLPGLILVNYLFGAVNHFAKFARIH